MSLVLDFIELDQLLPVVTLILLLAFIGEKMAAGRKSALTWARRSAAAGLIVSAIVLIGHLNPATPSEFLVVAIRAIMAAGLCWSINTVVFSVASSLYSATVSPVLSQQRKAQCLAQVLRDHQAEQLAKKRSEDLAIEESRRREQRNARTFRQSQRQAANAEIERTTKIQAAREEATRFFNEHAHEIQESFPSALFQARMQKHLASTLPVDQIWPAAETLIAEIVTVIDQARGEIKRANAEERRIQTLIDSHRLQIQEIEREKILFTQSPTADAEVVAYELQAFDHRIAAIQDEIDSLIRKKEPTP